MAQQARDDHPRHRPCPAGPSRCRSPERHVVLGTPMTPPWPDGTEVLYVAMGCFWGAERIFWQIPGVITTAAGYTGGFTANPTLRADLHRPHRPHRGRPGRLRPRGRRRRRPAQGVLGEPRPDAAQRPGQRHRHAVPQRRSTRRPRRSWPPSRGLARPLPGGADDGRLRPHHHRGRPFTDAGPFYYAEDYHQQYLHKNPGGYCNHGFCQVGLRPRRTSRASSCPSA